LPSGDTVLAQLATSMQPGDWAELSTNGLSNQSLVFSIQFNTIVGKTYIVEYSASLQPAQWILLDQYTGQGGVQLATDIGLVSQERFYRVRVY